MKVVIDTNVVVSGLLFGGLPALILDLILERTLIWCSSTPLKDEMDRVLLRPKFKLEEDEYLRLVEPFYGLIEWHIPTHSIDIITRCPADNRVLECAIESRSEAIITGDRRDLVSLNPFRGVQIVQPKEFLSWLLNN